MSNEPVSDENERTTPAAVFSAIGSERRLAILRALWDAEGPTSFTDLYGRAGMRDSAQFNYHLRQLTDHFVRKTEAGYELSHAGKRVVRALLVGTFTADAGREIGIDGACIDCGAALRASYDDFVTIECGECDRLHSRYPFPPAGLVGRDDAAVLDVYDRWTRASYAMVAAGVCSECGGAMTTALGIDPGEMGGECHGEYGGTVGHHCAQCRHRVAAPVGMSLLTQADVIDFHRDHGIDLASIPYWELDWCVSDRHTTTVSDEPPRVRVTIGLDDEELHVTVDDSLGVLNVERVPRPA